MKNKNTWKPSLVNVQNGELVLSEKIKNSASYIVSIFGIELINQLFPKYLKGKLLDLGCGFVPYYEFYKPFIDDNVCVDWENSLHKNEYLDHACDLNQPLPFENECFDSILSTAVLEHLYNPKQFVKECTRILKQGGILILSSNFCYWEHEIPFDYFRYTQFFYKKIAEENNLEVLELHPVGDGIAVIADTLAKISFSLKHKNLIYRWLYKITKYIALRNLKNNKTIFSKMSFGHFAVYRKK